MSKGSGTDGDGDGSGDGCIQAHDLRVEVAVRRDGSERGRRVARLRDENQRLKKLVADLSLDKEALKGIVRKNGWSLPV